MSDGTDGITEILREWCGGTPEALEKLMPLVFGELRKLARSHFRREPSGHTLQPTALVNEVYLRLERQMHVQLINRTQFFAFASRLMRRILVDHHRTRQAEKRGNGQVLVTLDEALRGGRAAARARTIERVDILALDEALELLKELDPRQCRVVELRYFGGLTIPETAQVLGISPATVKREWAVAKAWLQYRLRSPGVSV